MTQGRIVLVWRELAAGGGVGTYVRALARLLAPDLPVTVVTEEGQDLAGLLPENVDILTVRAPTALEIATKGTEVQAYSVLVFEALLPLLTEDPPALIEFQDYGAEGLTVLQGRQAAHPALRATRCVVRVNTTTEMVTALNGAMPADRAWRERLAAEATCLRLADSLLYGGGQIAASYERFYGRQALAPWELLRQPLDLVAEEHPWPDAARLELLYLGRTERRKGVDALVEAVRILGRDDIRLTLFGGDTNTGPLGTSVGDAVTLAAGNDERIRLLPFAQEGSGGIREALRRAHAVVMPSRWECWPAAALEGFAHNRPLIATNVGGLAEMTEDPRTALRISRPRSAEAIAEALEAFADARESWAAAVQRGEPARRFRELADPAPVRDWYRAAAEAAAGRARWRRPLRHAERPLVTVGVPYYRAHLWVEATLKAIRAQTYDHIELLIVNDGSFEREDRRVAQLARAHGARLLSQTNGGVGRARNLIAANARGRYVLFLDADNLIHPSFVERGVDLLERDPTCHFFTSWLAYMDHRDQLMGADSGYWPIGHQLELLNDHNVAGDAAMIVRRSVFAQGLQFDTDLVSYEDHDFYRQMRDAGLDGAIYPDTLVQYRVRPDSNLRTYGLKNAERSVQELRAHRMELERFA